VDVFWGHSVDTQTTIQTDNRKC